MTLLLKVVEDTYVSPRNEFVFWYLCMLTVGGLIVWVMYLCTDKENWDAITAHRRQQKGKTDKMD